MERKEKETQKQTVKKKTSANVKGSKSAEGKCKNISSDTAQNKKIAKDGDKNIAPAVDGGAQVKKERKKSIFGSAFFWTAVFVAILLLLALNVFGTFSVSPDMATANLATEQQIRYGSQSKLTLKFDKPVNFEEESTVIWTVDGVEVQRGTTKQNESLTLQHNFSSVGKHRVTAQVEGYDNLTVQKEVEVLKPVLTVKVNDCKKVYGEENPVPQYEVSGFVDGDDAKSANFLFVPQFDAAKNSAVGEYNIKTVPTNSKYDVQIVGGKLTVLPKTLTVYTQNASKIYDGSTDVSGKFVLNGVLGGDTVTLKYNSAHFVDKNAGANKQINFDGAALEGKDAQNYRLAVNSVYGEILPKTVVMCDFAVSDKYYDGNTNATFGILGNFDGVAAGDEVNVAELSARFETPDAGENKPVVIEKCILGGKDAQNYVVKYQENLTATIKAAQ